jgi:small subunit ribosomal protein S8
MKQTVNDFVVSVKNGVRANHTSVKIAKSKLTFALASILVAEGFVESYTTHNRWLNLHLRSNALTDISVVRSTYCSKRQLPQIFDGLGVVIVSTSKGILTDKKARSLNVGGQLVCCVW